MENIDIFISHAHDDAMLAVALVELIRGCVKMDASAIRCSSAPGYGFSLGHISSQIRKELQECSIVLGIITENSIRSDYVAIELGAGWYLDKAWALLGSGVDYTDIPGPIKEHNALMLGNTDDIFKLIKEISKRTLANVESVDIINFKVNAFIAFYNLHCKEVSNKKIKINVISGVDNIFSDAINMVKTTKKRIRATNFGGANLPPPKIYVDTINEILTDSIRRNAPIEFRIVGSPRVGLQERIELMNNDIKHLVKHKTTEISKVLLNVLIVDDVCAQISFPESSVDTHFRTCMSINGEQEIIDRLIDWYDEFLWN